MVRLEDLKIFCAVVDNGSLSAASRVLDISPAVASVAIKRLEKTLATQLLIRSTRSLSLTQAGESYLEHAKTALEAIALGGLSIARNQGAIGGRLTIAVPSDLGRGLLRKMIDTFQAMHPALAVKLMPSDRITDLYKMQVDVAIRYGQLNDSRLIAVPLVADSKRVVCASPAYLSRFGIPTHPNELKSHQCLCFMLNNIVHNKWQFNIGHQTHVVTVMANKVSDDGDIVRQWAVDDKGIAYKSELDVLQDLRTGKLTLLLNDFATEIAPLYFISAQRATLSPAIDALKKHLLNAFNNLLNQPH